MWESVSRISPHQLHHMNSATRIFFSNALAKTIKSRAVHRVYSESQRISLKWTDLKCIWLICRISKSTAYLPCLLWPSFWPSFWSSFSGKQLWLDHIIKWLKLVSYQHGSDSVKLGWLNIRISQKLQPRSKSSRTNMQLSLLKMNLNKSKESRYIKMTSRWNEIWMFSVQCQLPLVSSPSAPQTVTLHESSPARHMWWQLDRVWPGNVTKIDDVEKEEIWKHLEAATCSGSDTFVVHSYHLHPLTHNHLLVWEILWISLAALRG